MSMTVVDTPGHGHHGHDPNQQHHFASMAQQFDSAKIGMWLFLATEILLFGGLFVGYGIMQGQHAEAFKSAHHHLDKRLGFLNTVVLLVSSWTMVMAVYSASVNKRKATVILLIITLLCAGTFMVVKYFEYSHKIHDGLLPGKYFSYKGPHLERERMFFSFYFMMTGLHGIHVLLGMVAISWLIFRANRGDFSSSWYTPVDLVGLYWHLVDLIWIYLFPLLYLIQ
ncbi:MAG: cytochrome c oxidase subunit 3 family protein [Bryobacteraceae bacterium]|nr:cytochrome c oxidase subunit 3 family protein [Bryobacteraceae bacterium]